MKLSDEPKIIALASALTSIAVYLPRGHAEVSRGVNAYQRVCH